MYTQINAYVFICTYIYIYICVYMYVSNVNTHSNVSQILYGVAMISRLDRLFCRISSILYGSFAKETYNFKEPINRSHPIPEIKSLYPSQVRKENLEIFRVCWYLKINYFVVQIISFHYLKKNNVRLLVKCSFAFASFLAFAFSFAIVTTSYDGFNCKCYPP